MRKFFIATGLALLCGGNLNGKNFIVNPDFENDFDGWKKSKYISLETGDVHSGKKSMRVEEAPGSPETIVLGEFDINQKEAEPFEFSCWEKRLNPDGAKKGGITITVFYGGGSIENLYWQFQVDAVEANAWAFKWYAVKPMEPIKKIKISARGNCGLLLDDLYAGPIIKNVSPEEMELRKRALPVTVVPMENKTYSDFPARLVFHEISPEADVINYEGPEKMPLVLNFDYEVLKAAPVCLDSSWGSQIWRAFNLNTAGLIGFHTDEKISLEKTGKYKCSGKFLDNEGVRKKLNPVEKGSYLLLAGQGNTKTFNINTLQDGSFLTYFKIVNMARHYKEREQKPVFLLANLKRYSLDFSRLGADWKKNGKVWAEITLTDDDLQSFQLYGASVSVKAGENIVVLKQQSDSTGMPTGLFVGELKGNADPEFVEFSADIKIRNAEKLSVRNLKSVLSKGQGETVLKLETISPKCVFSGIRGADCINNSLLDKGPAELEKFIANAHKAGINTLTVEALLRGEAIFKSNILPQKYPDRDSLLAIIDMAHRYKMKVATVVTLFHKYGNAHEDWSGVDSSGKKMEGIYSVSNPEVRKYYLDIIKEILAGYDVDIMYVDYIRFCGSGYSEADAREFEKKFGKKLQGIDPYDPDFWAWKLNIISSYMKDIRETVREAKPGVKVMAYVWAVYNTENSRVEQNLAKWLKYGYADYIQVGAYTGDPYTFRAISRAVRKLKIDNDMEGRVDIYPMPGVHYAVLGAVSYDDALERLTKQVRISSQECFGSINFFSAHPFSLYMQDIGKEFFLNK